MNLVTILPRDISLLVFQLLDRQSLGDSILVCKSWKNFINDSFWKNHCPWAHCDLHLYGGSYLRVYLDGNRKTNSRLFHFELPFQGLEKAAGVVSFTPQGQETIISSTTEIGPFGTWTVSLVLGAKLDLIVTCNLLPDFAANIEMYAVNQTNPSSKLIVFPPPRCKLIEPVFIGSKSSQDWTKCMSYLPLTCLSLVKTPHYSKINKDGQKCVEFVVEVKVVAFDKEVVDHQFCNMKNVREFANDPKPYGQPNNCNRLQSILVQKYVWSEEFVKTFVLAAMMNELQQRHSQSFFRGQ